LSALLKDNANQDCVGDPMNPEASKKKIVSFFFEKGDGFVVCHLCFLKTIYK